jgi:AraC-like DNA-binding protein
MIRQMPYNMSQSGAPTLLVIENRDARTVKTGVWSSPYRHTSWMMDFWSGPKMACRVTTPDGKERAFERRCTWHIYAPGVAYSERYDESPPWEMLWFQFSPGSALPPLTRRAFTAVHDPEERIAPYARAMYVSQQRGEPGSDLIRRGLLLAILGEAIAAGHRGHAGTPEDPWLVSPGAESANLLQRVDAHVLRRVTAPPSLDELARALDMSVSSLTHRFRTETGMTIVDRVRWLRIREARQLLAKRGADVKSVAQRLGFSSPFYFSKVFHEVTGVTASDYLRRSRK